MKQTLKRILVRLAFYPSFCFNRIMCLIGIWYRWDRVDQHLFVGAMPSRSDIARLKELGVGAIINMCWEFRGHSEQMRACGITQLELPTLDFHSPSEQDIFRGIDFVRECARNGKSVYIHCKSGRLRSATLAVCCLVADRRISGQEAYDRIKEIRPQVNRDIAQRAVVRTVEQALADGDIRAALLQAPKSPTAHQIRRRGSLLKLSRALAGRTVSWASLIIPKKHREDIAGDFFETLEEAKKRGYGRFAITTLKIAKCLLYVWIGLKLRVTDFVSLEAREKETR